MTLTLIISISSVLIIFMLAVTVATCIIMRRKKQEKVEDLSKEGNIPKIKEKMPHSKVFRATIEEEQAQDVHKTAISRNNID
jgi:cytochrome c biogenesis protein ResB